MSNTTKIKEHKRDGKKLIPPLLQIPKMSRRSWLNDALPEMIWAALLIVNLERDVALEIFRKITDILAAYAVGKERDEIRFNVTHTGLSFLDDEKLRKVLKEIMRNPKAREALRPLLFYKNLPAFAIWKEVIDKEPVEEDWNLLFKAVRFTLFHQTQEATDCRWLKVLFLIKTNKLSMPREEALKILGYPNVGDMREVRPTIRATELAFDMPDIAVQGTWAKTFWKDSLKLTGCIGSKSERKSIKTGDKAVKDKLNNAFSKLISSFVTSLKTTQIDSKRDAIYGFAIYSWILVMEIMVTSELMISRLGLRTLLETYITLCYLLQKDDTKLWDAYRIYGTGQAKLAQLKFEEMGSYPSFVDKKLLDEIVNEDAWIEFVPVDLGHWDDKSLRDLSQLTGVKDLYDKYYVWSSSFTHAQWGAVRETVFETCMNPLHRLHRVPILSAKFFPEALPDAINIFDKVMDLVSKVYPSPKK